MKIKAVILSLFIQVAVIKVYGQTSSREVIICFDGRPVYLTAESINATSYQWFKGYEAIPGQIQATLQINETGVYRVVAYNDFCPSDTSDAIRVDSKRPEAIDDRTTAQVGMPATIFVSRNDMSGCAPLDPRSITITEAPKYGELKKTDDGAIVYVASWDADDIDNFMYTINDTAGLVSNTASVHIDIQKECATVYPNPVTNILHLSLQHKSINKLRIADISGQILYTDDVTEPNKTVLLQDYAAGMYILQLLQGDNVRCVYKIIKKD